MKHKLIVLLLLVCMLSGINVLNNHLNSAKTQPQRVLASRVISMEDRYPIESVNTVFKDNILLNIAYMEGSVKKSQTPAWEAVTKPFTHKLTLKPNETFAYHEDVLPQYQGKVTKTTNAHFNAQEGFKFSGLYFGDGVCHLASVMYWAAKDAGLDAQAPTNHDFAAIPQVPREYGVSIYNEPGNVSGNARQNLYITNTKNKAITMEFTYDGSDLTVAVVEAS